MLHHLNAHQTKPERVVIVGSSGFVGQSLVQKLSRHNLPVLCIGRKDLDFTAPEAFQELAKLLNPSDSLIFLAAITPDKGKGIDPLVANIQIASTVSKAIELVKIKHTVYFSSDAVYPISIPLINEESSACAEDLYGIMHRTRELMMLSTGVPTAILRPTLIYGEGDTHNSYGPNRLRRAAHKDRSITLFGGGEEKRDHIYVEDVAELARLALFHASTGTLNLATGSSISYFDLANQIASLFPFEVEVKLTERKNPVTHRHFDITSIYKSFPEFQFTDRNTALQLCQQDLAEAA